jgi:hypothetical protein
MTKESMQKEEKGECNMINSIILNNVEIQENGIIRNEKGYLIGRLVPEIDYMGEHCFGLRDLPTPKEPRWKEELSNLFNIEPTIHLQIIRGKR